MWVGGLCSLYRVIQEERLIFWEVIVSVIVRKKVHINMRLIVAQIELFDSTAHTHNSAVNGANKEKLLTLNLI